METIDQTIVIDDITFDVSELRDQMESETDFTIDGDDGGEYRFIHTMYIDEIQREELKGDTYMLGCFTDWFIADIIGINGDAVKKIQEADGAEALGELMLQHIDEVQEKYSSMDGYGHHFAAYDHYEHNHKNFYFFRTN